LERSTFLNLTSEKISEIVRSKNTPKVGIFVPDGNRRIVLATTNLQENTDDFFNELISRQISNYLNILEIFFSHGLSILFIPLFSQSVLSRSSPYNQRVFLETIKFICTNDECLTYYDNRDIRIKFYGNISALKETASSQAKKWLEEVQELTSYHATHTFFIGIGGEPWIGNDTAQAAVRFDHQFQHEPSKNELIEFMYGPMVPPADFFIMSSKFAGLGALPGLICGHDTQAYYLPVPGILGLNEVTYRSILFDLIFMRTKQDGNSGYHLNVKERSCVNDWYLHHKNEVIGLGHRIGSTWVPEILKA